MSLIGLTSPGTSFNKLSADEVTQLKKDLESLGEKDPKIIFEKVVELLKDEDPHASATINEGQKLFFQDRDALHTAGAKEFANTVRLYDFQR